jgi:hypothetical protein
MSRSENEVKASSKLIEQRANATIEVDQRVADFLLVGRERGGGGKRFAGRQWEEEE